MKVLFVSSGNKKKFNKISPFIKTQGESLTLAGIDVQYFPIIGKGILGYLMAAMKLRKHLKHNLFDIIHAHYTLSGWVAVLSFPRQPIVLSLMGSDTYGQYIREGKKKFSSSYLIILTFLIQPFVKSIICKSNNIKKNIFFNKKTRVIPNGVSLEKFKYHSNNYRKELNLNSEKQYILFLGSKSNRRKNFKLAQVSIKHIKSGYISLIAPYPVEHDKVIKYLNSVDVLILTSLMEGSPNVVKEAMACNCPVVATDVGDVRWLFGNTEGYYITSFDPEDVAEKIKRALEFPKRKGRPKGRERIIQLGLDSDTVAKKIINVYKEALSR